LEYFFAFSALVAGIMTIFLEKEWFRTIDDKLKVPVYGLFGSSLTFIFIYIMVDLTEMVKEFLSFIYTSCK